VFGIFGHPITYLVHYSIIISLFYVHAEISLPWVLREKNSSIYKLSTIIIIEITSYIILSFLADKFLMLINVIPFSKTFTLSYQYSLKTLYRGMFFFGFSTGYYYLKTFIKERRKTNELEKQRLQDIIYRQDAEQQLVKSQNAFLKAQINPHFLFNSLDFIYHNIETSSPTAAEAVIVLSEMMRYAIDSDKMGDFVLLQDEIEQVENLIYLNQMRKNNELLFKLNIEESVRTMSLIPLVLLTLVENIFKHGNWTEPGGDATLSIYTNDKYFIIETNNLVNTTAKKSTYTGLKNIEKRLLFTYGEKAGLNYFIDDKNYFKLHLQIPLTQMKARVWPEAKVENNDIR